MPQGLDFRATSGYVTDPPNCTYEIGQFGGEYPRTTPQGYTVGLESVVGTSSASSRDRSLTNDPRLAGIGFTTSAGLLTYRIDLQAPGSIDITAAGGDPSSSTTGSKVLFQDGTTQFATMANNIAVATAHFVDATGVVRTSNADWVANNAILNHTFGSGTFRIVVGQGTSNSFLNHIYINEVGGGGTAQNATGKIDGAGLLTVAAVEIDVASASPAGAGAVNARAVETMLASVTLAGSGNVNVPAVEIELATTNGGFSSEFGSEFGTSGLAGSGNVSVSAVLIEAASATLAGSGAVSVGGSHTPLGASTLAGVGSLAVSAAELELASAVLAGAGSLGVATVEREIATIALAGTGGITTVSNPPGTVTWQGSASIAGAGGLRIAAVELEVASVGIGGVGSLNVSGSHSPVGGASLAGAGSFNVAAVLLETASVFLAGTGGIVTTPVPGTQGAGANIGGSGSLGISAVVREIASAALAGVGSDSVVAALSLPAVIPVLAGAGALTLAGMRETFATTRMDGIGSFAGTSLRSTSASASLAGVGLFGGNVSYQLEAVFLTIGGSGGINLIAQDLLSPIFPRGIYIELPRVPMRFVIRDEDEEMDDDEKWSMSPGSTRTFTVECRSRIQLVDKIASVTVVPSPNDMILLGSPRISGTMFSFTVMGGVENVIPYMILCSVTTVQGDTTIFKIPVTVTMEILDPDED